MDNQGYAGKLTPLGVFEILHHDLNGTDFAVYVDKSTGKADTNAGPLNNGGFITNVIGAATFAGIEITEVIAGVVCEPQEDVPDWDQYEILN